MYSKLRRSAPGATPILNSLGKTQAMAFLELDQDSVFSGLRVVISPLHFYKMFANDDWPFH